MQFIEPRHLEPFDLKRRDTARLIFFSTVSFLRVVHKTFFEKIKRAEPRQPALIGDSASLSLPPK
jgi:hypothetical protein